MAAARELSDTGTAPLSITRVWHALSAEEALSVLESRPNGLTAVEAGKRLATYGPNALVAVPVESAWRILLRQVKSVVAALLLVATVLAWFTSDALDALAILVVLLLNTTIGFVTELRARRAMEALVRLDSPHAVVLRDGARQAMDAIALVPGDVIELEAGQSIPADARLLSSTELQTSEAALTGESVPVTKHADARPTADTPLPDRVTMVYKGTSIANGVGRALVVATGMGTEVGRIGTLVGSIREGVSPLERRMDALGTRLAGVAVGIGVLVALIDLARGESVGVVLQMGIAVAIAAVPEGLPAVVTTTMAIAMRRMARRHALARRMPAIESLGSVTVVCTDKTGTLTSGVQTVTSISFDDAEVDVAADEGDFTSAGRSLTPRDERRLARALTIAALANRAALSRTSDHWTGQGDPTEVALLVAARKIGLQRVRLLDERPEVGELPFSSARMIMATIHRADAGELAAYLKGAPHRVLARCSRALGPNGEYALDASARSRIEARATEMATRGLRVIALADGPVADTTDSALRDLTFVALTGITDPPAAGVVETIAALRGAGIRTLMLTGDHAATALVIARQVGVADDRDETLDGSAVDKLTDGELDQHVRQIGVVSRVSPEGKLRVVQSLQRRGEVVAMLGDGINDAAALKQAEIGVAMGGRGTDAAKEVADIVLEDDRFPTIAAAVEEGRVVQANISKFVFYLFSCNLAEVAVLLLAGVMGLPLPMTPMQVLWMNLVTDTFPALALAIEPGEANVLRQPPRDPSAPILSRFDLVRGVGYTVIITGVTMAALLWGLARWPNAADRAVTLSFTTLALAQIFHLGNARSRGPVTSLSRAVANRYALAAVAITVPLQVLAVTARPLARVLGTTPMDWADWEVAVALAAVPAVLGQLWKLLRSSLGRR